MPSAREEARARFLHNFTAVASRIRPLTYHLTARHLLWKRPGLFSLRRIFLSGLRCSVVTLNDWNLPRGTAEYRNAIYDN